MVVFLTTNDIKRPLLLTIYATIYYNKYGVYAIRKEFENYVNDHLQTRIGCTTKETS